jgi:hypothetical protein
MSSLPRVRFSVTDRFPHQGSIPPATEIQREISDDSGIYVDSVK